MTRYYFQIRMERPTSTSKVQTCPRLLPRKNQHRKQAAKYSGRLTTVHSEASIGDYDRCAERVGRDTDDTRIFAVLADAV
jgi:hypothetical protein